MFSLKCDKTLIKQIIKLQNQRPGFKRINRESFPFKTAVRAKSRFCWYDIKFYKPQVLVRTIPSYTTHTWHIHWLCIQLISSLKVCYSSEQKIKTQST